MANFVARFIKKYSNGDLHEPMSDYMRCIGKLAKDEKDECGPMHMIAWNLWHSAIVSGLPFEDVKALHNVMYSAGQGVLEQKWSADNIGLSEKGHFAYMMLMADEDDCEDEET
jgi:hypothetical protein